MGVCCSSSISGSPEDREINKEIDSRMKASKIAEKKCHSILLLGAGDAGKTTILKQMRKIHGKKEDYKSNDINNTNNNNNHNQFKSAIIEQLLSMVVTLCTKCIELNLSNLVSSEAILEHITWFANPKLCNRPFSQHLSPNSSKKITIEMIESIWTDNALQQTYLRRSEFQIGNNITYFLQDRLHDMLSSDYDVTFGDVLRMRIRTIGFSSETFLTSMNGHSHEFRFTDVGGQRCERTKWMNMVHGDIDAVVYVVAISEYDQYCYEDDATLRLDESLSLFETIVKNGFCDDKSLILFFNKYDLFLDKLNDQNVQTIQQVYANDDDNAFNDDFDTRDPNHVCQYIYGKFLKIYKKSVQNTRNNTFVPHFHCTTALDTDQIDEIMHDVENDLTKRNLDTLGL